MTVKNLAHTGLCLFLLCLVLLCLFLLGPAGKAFAYEGPIGTSQMLINKTYRLSPDAQAGDLVDLNQYISAAGGVQLCRPAAEALGQMVAAMQADGVSGLTGTSGYRSYDLQTTLYQRKVAYYQNLGYGLTDAETYGGQVVAIPGASEHQTGLAIDVTAGGTGLTESFATTKAGQWLAEHCWEYGFILRYPQDRTTDTGYIYEPWHFRYVGLPHAEYIYKNQLILEDYVDQLQKEGVIGMISSVTGQTYAVYACQDLSAIDTVPGQILSVSYATADKTSYLVTTLATADTLYDIVGHWGEQNIRHLVMLDIVTGYTDNTFRPGRDISRAELVTLTARTYGLLFPGSSSVLGTLPYGDVLADDYYAASLWLCYSRGLLPPSMQPAYNQGRFLPNQKVLRWEAAQALAPLFTALPQVPEGSVTFQDLLDASPELRHAVQLLADYGILNGDGLGNFNPDATITRAEICAMLDRILLYFFDTTPADDATDEGDESDEGDATDRGDESDATDASNKEDRPNAGTDASEEGVGANR